MRTASDEPIRQANEDALSRDRFAQSFARRVEDVDCSNHGVVVGVLGPWGSGKTSFVNLVRNHLGEADIPVLEFNPWMFSGTAELVDAFFVELSSQLKLHDRLRTVGKRLTEYGEAFGSLGWLPWVGPWLSRAGSVSRILAKWTKRGPKGTALPRERLRTALDDLDRPLVIVLDDIDRLDSTEIRQVFKLIRLIANLPNVVYLVAFDRQRVEEALADDAVPGRAYLEKILQVAVDLPQVPTEVLHRQVFTALDDALSSVDHRRLDEQRWPDVFVEVIHPLINNMRDVTRYANAVHWTVNEVGDAIDIVDLLALEAVRVFMPDAFVRLPEAVDGLTKPSSSFIGGSTEPEHLGESVQALVDASEPRGSVMRALISRLFPAGARHIGGVNYGADFQKSWLRDRLVAHPDLLRMYLERVAGRSLQAFGHAEHAFELMDNESDFTNYVESLNLDHVEDVVSALETFEPEYTPTQVVPGVTVLLNLLPRLPERPLGMFDFGPRLTVTRVTVRLLRSLPGSDEVEAAVSEILPRLDGLSLQLELLDDVGHRPDRGHRLVTEEFYYGRLQTWRDRLRVATVAELASEYDLGRTMLLAKRDAGEDEPSLEVPDDVKVTEALLKSLTSESRSQSVDSRAVRRRPRIAWDVFCELVGGDEAAADRIAALEASGLLDSETLILAKQYVAGWRPPDFE